MKFFLRVLDNGRILIKDLQTQKALVVKDMKQVSKEIQEIIDGSNVEETEKEPTEFEKYKDWHDKNIQERLDDQETEIIGDSGDDSGDLSGVESSDGNGSRES